MTPEYGEAFGRQTGADRHQVMRDIVRRMELPRIDMLEIGVWTGHGTATWRAAIAELCPQGGTITCVDPWRQYHHPDDLSYPVCREMDKALTSGRAYELFLHNIRWEFHQEVFVSHHRGTLREVFPLIAERRFDLIFVDGSHYYPDVVDDLELSPKLLHDGGILGGDDLEAQRDDIPDWETYCKFTGDYNGSHPGVTRAVWERFSERVWCERGTWAMRYKDGKFQQPWR